MPVALYLMLNILHRKDFQVLGYPISIPGFRLFGSQMAVALLDWFVAGYIFYILLPHNPHLPLIHVLSVFLLAQLAGLASQIPGGLGVFETVVVLLLSSVLPASSIIGSLLVYRGMYYILPPLDCRRSSGHPRTTEPQGNSPLTVFLCCTGGFCHVFPVSWPLRLF